MKQKVKSKRSLYTEWFMLLALAGFISIIFFWGTYYITDGLIENHFKQMQTVKESNDRYAEKLKNYIKDNNLSAGDLEELEKWVRSEKIIMIKVFKDKQLVYDSEYDSEYDIEKFLEEVDIYDWEDFYEIEFSDGMAMVCISGVYSYKIYTVALITEIILSFILFLGICVLGIRGKIQYILKLSQEIEMLESGNLDYEITIRGRDELTELAKGLNAMRESFQKQIEREEYLLAANQSMVTEISHDMRTPLTSIILYAEMLHTGKYRDEQQMKEYIYKILKKTNHMKNLSDHLFDYSLCAKESKVILEAAEDIKVVLYDQLSEFCGYLEEQGYNFETRLTWENVKIQVNMEYICRIFDNISSNIIKYADKNKPIIIESKYNTNGYELIFENHRAIKNKVQDSNNIGMYNIKNMMLSMNGDCNSTCKENKYIISLYFKTV